MSIGLQRQLEKEWPLLLANIPQLPVLFSLAAFLHLLNIPLTFLHSAFILYYISASFSCFAPSLHSVFLSLLPPWFHTTCKVANATFNVQLLLPLGLLSVLQQTPWCSSHFLLLSHHFHDFCPSPFSHWTPSLLWSILQIHSLSIPWAGQKTNLLHFFLTWTGHSLSMKKAWRFLMQMVAEEMQFDYNWRITLWITTNKPKKALNITQTISMGKLNPQKLDNNKVQQVQTKKTKESQSWIITITHPDVQDRLHHLTLAKLFWLLKGCVYSTPQ